MSIMTATIPKCVQHNNNENLINADGNINYSIGAICANSSHVSAKSNKIHRSSAVGKFHVNESNSFLGRRRREGVPNTNGLLVLMYLLSAAVILEANSTVANLDHQTIAAKRSSNTTTNAEFHSNFTHTFDEKLSTTTHSTMSVGLDSSVALTSSTQAPLNTISSTSMRSPVSLTPSKLSASAPLEAFTTEPASAESTAKDMHHDSGAIDKQSPPSSEVLIKGFSIPTFLPPFPKFAMADLPALTLPSTTSNESDAELYPASYLKKMHQQNTSIRTTNITIQMGNHAYLPCTIQRMFNKPISWVRLRDEHILSVDQATFIADQRFQPIFHGDNDFTWSMQIKYVQKTDEGWYECQSATEPKMSAKVYLTVVVPHTELIGDQIRFVKAGSKVALHCIVRDTLDPPTYIIWFRGKTQITNDNQMGWYTEIDRAIFGNVESKRNTIGSLIIPFVRKNDSGNYTCEPSNSAPVSVDLHVLSGEYSASAIMSAARSYQLNEPISICNLFIVLPLLLVLPKA